MVGAKNVRQKKYLQLKVKFYDQLYLNPASSHVNSFKFLAIKAIVRCLSLFLLYKKAVQVKIMKYFQVASSPLWIQLTVRSRTLECIRSQS